MLHMAEQTAPRCFSKPQTSWREAGPGAAAAAAAAWLRAGERDRQHCCKPHDPYHLRHDRAHRMFDVSSWKATQDMKMVCASL